MKKLVLILALSAPLLGGCATGSLSIFGTGISLVTKSIANPVTKTEEVQAEVAIDAAVALLKGYKKACIEGTADTHCRGNIIQVQAYTKKMTPLIAQLRDFVDNNDQINAVVIYNQLTALYSNFKSTAASLGYNVGNLP